MKTKISGLLVTALGLALLVYSAARSLDFISLTLPPDKQVLAWFGLAALDGGLVLWLLHFLYSARGAWQRGIALLMIVIDFLGAAGMFTLDTLYRTGEAGMTTTLSPESIRAAVLALSGVIALNVAATVATHVLDPEARRQMAAEEAQDAIQEAALTKLTEQAPNLAAELAPILAQDYLARTRARYLSLLGNGPGIIDGGKLGDPQPEKRRANPFVLGWAHPRRTPTNGKAVYNAETEQPAGELQEVDTPKGSGARG